MLRLELDMTREQLLDAVTAVDISISREVFDAFTDPDLPQSTVDRLNRVNDLLNALFDAVDGQRR